MRAENQPLRDHGGNSSFFTALITSKIAAGALAASTLAVGGTAAAAYTGSLPEPLQQSAHSLIGAPRPSAVQPAIAATPADTATATASPSPTDTSTASPTATAPPTDTAIPTASPTDTAQPTSTAEPTETAEPTDPVTGPARPVSTGPAAFGLCNAYAHGGLGGEDLSGECDGVTQPGNSASHRQDGAAGSAEVQTQAGVPSQAVQGQQEAEQGQSAAAAHRPSSAGSRH